MMEFDVKNEQPVWPWERVAARMSVMEQELLVKLGKWNESLNGEEKRCVLSKR